MSQITLRKIPEPLEKQLRSLADKNETSLNKIIINLLMKSLGISPDSTKKRDLSDLCGTWDENQYNEFQKNTEYFSQIDREIWE
ncbi:MAG: hypothetical protein JEY91_09260 [Spirochaetaceae bacterium]|nr:hypothetical protein [Spirochaetaceae bacterium]